jgi:hypothetical protein
MVFLQNGEHRFIAAIRDNTAWLEASTLPVPKAALCGVATLSRALWHCCLCHIGTDCLQQANKGKIATGLVVKSDAPAPSHCEPWMLSASAKWYGAGQSWPELGQHPVSSKGGAGPVDSGAGRALASSGQLQPALHAGPAQLWPGRERAQDTGHMCT